MWRKIGLFAMIILLGAITNLGTGATTNVNVADSSIATNQSKSGYDIFQTDYTLENGYKFKCIQARNMEDKELENKIFVEILRDK